MADHDKNIIEVSGVSFAYGKRQVLHDVNINVHHGDYLGIVGPNGGGKTTLLKLILGLLKPEAGTIKLFDTDIRSFHHWQKIGYVPQKAVSFDAHFPATVLEVVSMSGCSAEAAEKAITSVGMDEFSSRLIGQLSSGQQQRVFIARALATNPEILILDEPTVGIDAASQGKFYELLRDLNHTQGLTLVLVSHDLESLQREVTEMACIAKDLVYHGSASGFKSIDHYHHN